MFVLSAKDTRSNFISLKLYLRIEKLFVKTHYLFNDVSAKDQCKKQTSLNLTEFQKGQAQYNTELNPIYLPISNYS